MSIYLKPCPFCGRPAHIEESCINYYSNRMKIVCTGCSATIDHTQDFAKHDLINPVTGELVNTIKVALNESAIDIWNRRVEDDIY